MQPADRIRARKKYKEKSHDTKTHTSYHILLLQSAMAPPSCTVPERGMQNDRTAPPTGFPHPGHPTREARCNVRRNIFTANQRHAC